MSNSFKHKLIIWMAQCYWGVSALCIFHWIHNIPEILPKGDKQKIQILIQTLQLSQAIRNAAAFIHRELWKIQIKTHWDERKTWNVLRLSRHLNAVAWEEPAGAVVGVLAAGLQVEVVQPPVLELLAEVLDTHLQHTTVGLTYRSTQSNYVFAGKVKVRVENEAASCPWSCSWMGSVKNDFTWVIATTVQDIFMMNTILWLWDMI